MTERSSRYDAYPPAIQEGPPKPLRLPKGFRIAAWVPYALARRVTLSVSDQDGRDRKAFELPTGHEAVLLVIDKRDGELPPIPVDALMRTSKPEHPDQLRLPGCENAPEGP